MTRRNALRALGITAGTLLLRTRVSADQGELRIGGRPVELSVWAISDHTVRIVVAPVAAARMALDEDGALVEFPSRRLATGTSWRKSGAFEVALGTEPLSVRIADEHGTPRQDLRVDPASGALSFDVGDAPLLGFGEGGPQFSPRPGHGAVPEDTDVGIDRRGIVDQTRNGQGGYRLRTHGGRVPIQWLIGTSGWALFIHQPLGAFDLTGARGVMTPRDSALPIDAFVVVSPDPAVIMREYARITGLPQMPARWTLGYQQSHRTLAGPDEVMWVARTMREEKLPCDALIYLGTDFTPSGWNTHNGEFSWNPKNFPDPPRTIRELHDLHYKVVLHVVIEGHHLTGSVRDGCAAPEPSGRTPDGKWPDERSVGCYWPYHKPVYDLGIDGWWPDQGDGLDAASRLNRIRMYWEGPQLWRPDERPYALHRNGYAGMARYGAFLWSGDVYSTWETLRTHVPVAINTALSGIPYWGTDIGGFVATPELTGELYVRWFQFGAFCPLFRAHGRTWHLRLPWGWNTGDIGPDETSSYRGAGRPPESELHNAQVEPICRKYLELRYRLMPYLYSAVREASIDGVPILRALWLHYPDDPLAVARGDEYLWGRDILVAPVTEKGATRRSVYLPRGRWFDFWTEQPIDGGREVTRDVDLGTMPLYVRAGAIVPTGPVEQYTDEIADPPITITVYPGADGRFDLYDDDGRSFDYRHGAWTGMTLAWDDRARRLRVTLTPGSRPPAGGGRELRLRMVGSTKTTTGRFTGAPITMRPA
jgi:alpha-glucosidase/alpha-D-xyloside xylohydrolase